MSWKIFFLRINTSKGRITTVLVFGYLFYLNKLTSWKSVLIYSTVGCAQGKQLLRFCKLVLIKSFQKEGGGSNCQWTCARRAFGSVVLVVYGTSHKTSKINAFLNAFLLQVILLQALTTSLLMQILQLSQIMPHSETNTTI